MATVAVSAVGATTLLPGLRPVTMDVAEMAAIDESNTTIGITDSDLYFASPAEVDAALDQMQAMGVNTVRIGIPWAGINQFPGYYNWSQSDYMINAADARGMGVLAVITTTPGWATDPSAPGIYGHPASPADFGTFPVWLPSATQARWVPTRSGTNPTPRRTTGRNRTRPATQSSSRPPIRRSRQRTRMRR
jgi:hypothetical protein